ncbi:CotD family spore coat protein [Bacillus testis]|uniref:CotD family spore coat protein n=1 Tax=Bacillus testis TaxID=1622072 RepID=UPI000ABB90D0|nr:CotD family spore coat protein [Bacillus testis]
MFGNNRHWGKQSMSDCGCDGTGVLGHHHQMGPMVSPSQMGTWGAPSQMGSWGSMGPYAPQHTQVYPTQVAPSQVSPTQQSVNKNIFKTVVPKIHPSHTTTVNKHIIQNQHHFPHTESCINECCVENVICPPSPCGYSGMYPRPFHY